MLFFAMHPSFASPILTTESAAGFEGSMVSIWVNYAVGDTEPQKPVAIKFTLNFDKALVEAGMPIDGVGLAGDHVQFSRVNNSSGKIDVIIVPAAGKKPLSNSQILQIPFHLKSAGGTQIGNTAISPLTFSAIEMTDEALITAGTPGVGEIRITWLDSDRDGVPDYRDVFPSNPNESVDTDGDGIGNNTDGDDDNDGMSDAYELTNGLDSLNRNDASGDKDNDGLTNLYEYQIGTLANNPDTDGDGMPDGWEVKFGLNPRRAVDAVEDPDIDGLTNLQEYQRHTDPHNPDTDGDGVKDGDEVVAGTDPNLNIPALMVIIQQLLLN